MTIYENSFPLTKSSRESAKGYDIRYCFYYLLPTAVVIALCIKRLQRNDKAAEIALETVMVMVA
jgi:hypothetical protein